MSTLPPPASPLASILAVSMSTTSRPSTSTAPPLGSGAGLAATSAASAVPAPRTSMLPATVLRPAVADSLMLPPAMPVARRLAPASTVRLPCALMVTVPPTPASGPGAGLIAAGGDGGVGGAGTGAALALTSAPRSTVTWPVADVISTVPPLPPPPSALVWLPAVRVRSLLAASTIRPPMFSVVLARMSPLCLSVPANTPTAPPASLPSTVA